MYVSEHLKWRILIAQALKSFHFERENANRNLNGSSRPSASIC